MKKYIPSEIEAKWQKKWEDDRLYGTDLTKERKFYVLAEFPYPSGDLHMGHWFTFSGADIFARFKRMQGYNVFFPNGFDAFGLPAENAAIKRGIHPQDWTMANIYKMKNEQFATLGASFTFDHEVITCLPEYYRWNQWIFLRLLEKGLAYQDKYLSNWCPTCQTVLANEGVEGGLCWRCGTEVIQKEVLQWFFKITEYADRLLWPENPDDLRVDWPQSVREAQNQWIGRSEGARVKFQFIPSLSSPEERSHTQQRSAVEESSTNQPMEQFDERSLHSADSGRDDNIEVFTTRLDTIFGATFLVLAPEYDGVLELSSDENKASVQAYLEMVKKKGELERKENKEKTGVDTGARVINPFTNEEISVWVADYVLPGYGTGAIMAVPAHDERDHQFAKKFNLPIIKVIESSMLSSLSFRVKPRTLPNRGVVEGSSSNYSMNNPELDSSTTSDSGRDDINEDNILYTGYGKLINSGEYSGLSSEEAMKKLSEYIETNNIGSKSVQYHIHDWSISRQRYWGTPIPVIHCPKCGIVPVPDDQLPVTLPYEVDYTPKGKSPLASNEQWSKTACPKCGEQAQRDADTMDTFVDSSWYFFRYLNPKLESAPFDPQLAAQIMPVDVYFGGAEHTLGHTLYSRFFTKFFNDLGLTEMEEYAKRRINHGIVLGPDGNKMSKSKGNVVNPDEEVKKYGADAVRMHVAFFMPYDGVGPWISERIWGPYRFLERVWALLDRVKRDSSSSMSSRAETRTIQHRGGVEGSSTGEPMEQFDERSLHAGRDDIKNDDGLSKEDRIYLNKTIKKVAEDIEEIKFNTAIAALMEWLNHLTKKESISLEEYKTFLLLLVPFAPHMTEEIWQELGGEYSIHKQLWPEVDENFLQGDSVTVAIQINGKVRDSIDLPVDLKDQKEVEALVLAREKIVKHLEGKTPQKVIFVPGKVVSIVA